MDIAVTPDVLPAPVGPVHPASLPAPPGSAAASKVLQHMLEDRRSGATQRAYQADLRLFFASRGSTVCPEALAALCGLRAGDLAIVLNEYAAGLRASGLSPATINRRLSAIRSLLRLARKFGLTEVDPSGLVDNEKSRKYRDTRGPSVEEVAAMLATPDRSTTTGKRDYALIVLLWENALRRAEICACNIEDFDPKRRRLTIVGKGHGGEPEPVTLTKRSVKAIEDYLEARTNGARLDNGEPLFLNQSHSSGGRLRGGGLYYILRRYGAAVLGRELSPHQMRHAGTTAYLNASNGDVRGAQKLTRHADVRTVMIYDDNRADRQGIASETIGKLA